MYDIAVIGAGPAGATLARLIGKKYKVLLIDRRELLNPGDSSWEKTCGGLIAPDAQQVLAQLGLGVPGKVLVGPQLFAVRTIDIHNNIERYYQRNYINIDRERFDSWLVSLLPSAVDLRCGALFKRYFTKNNWFNIEYKLKGKEYAEKAKYLVGADGAFSTIRRQIVPAFFQPKYIAVQEWFKTSKTQPYYSAIFDREITDFYSWTIPKEDCILVGSAIPVQGNLSRKYNLLKERLIKRGFELQGSIKKRGAFIQRPQNLKQIFLGNGNITLIGEAAGWISPTSAEGFSYAFQSAVALSKSIEQNPENIIQEYIKNTRKLRLNIIQKNIKLPFMYKQFLRKVVMKSGLLSMDIER